MKLGIEMVPKSLWGTNLRRTLKQSKWRLLSNTIRKLNGYKCEMCGWEEDRGKREYTHCHEVWDYDDDNNIQSLKGLECLCPDCHAVHHWGHSKVTGRDMVALTEHAVAVNGCSVREWSEHVDEESLMWHLRSYRDGWTTAGLELIDELT